MPDEATHAAPTLDPELRRQLDAQRDQRIFVELASVRASEIVATIASAIDNAARPDRLRFGIAVRQGDAAGDHLLRERCEDPRFSIEFEPTTTDAGHQWRRHRAQSFYDGEPFTLQIDGDARFASDWDTRYPELLATATVERAVLTDAPLTMRHGLIVQDVSGENLVYDADSNVAAALNLPATRVFALCDGTRSVAQIVELLGNDEPAMPADAVKLALAELVDADLIDAPPVEAGSTRRQLLIKLGAAAAITLPAVELIAAPTAAAASSPPRGTTTTTTTTTTTAPVPAPLEVPQPIPSPADIPQPIPSPLEVPQPIPSPADIPQPIPSPLSIPQPVPSPESIPSPTFEPDDLD